MEYFCFEERRGPLNTNLLLCEEDSLNLFPLEFDYIFHSPQKRRLKIASEEETPKGADQVQYLIVNKEKVTLK